MSDAFERFKALAVANLAGKLGAAATMQQGVLGVCSEAGELAQVVRKAMYEREPHMTADWVRVQAREELADVMAYVAYMAELLDVSMDALLGMYLTKRALRGYSGSKPPDTEG